MQKVGSEALFPNSTTAASVNEVTRTLLRDRRTNGVPLELSVVWDQVQAAYIMSSGAGAENMDAALLLLTDSKPARVLLAQVRQPFSDKNGRDGQGYGGRKHVDDMSPAELRQEVSESRNTIPDVQGCRAKQAAVSEELANWTTRPGPSTDRTTSAQAGS